MWDPLVDTVLALFPDKSRQDVIADVEHTKSADETINRILDGTFLVGTHLDPSIAVVTRVSSFLFSDDYPDPPAPARSQNNGAGETVSLLSSDDDADSRHRVYDNAKKRQLEECPASVHSNLLPRQRIKISPPRHAAADRDDSSDSDLSVIDLLGIPGPSAKSKTLTSLKSAFHIQSSQSASAEMEKMCLSQEKPSRKTRIIYGASDDSPEIGPCQEYVVLSDCDSSDDKHAKSKRAHRIPKIPATRLSGTNSNQNCRNNAMSCSDSDDSVKNDPSKNRPAKKAPDGKGKKQLDNAAKLAQKAQQKADRELEKETKRLEKEREKAEKKAAKELEKAQKLMEKEHEKMEKQMNKSANKLRNKHQLINEMVCEIDSEFVARPGGAGIVAAVQGAGAEVKIKQMPIPATITWSRKVTREWDDGKENWRPCDPRVDREGFVLVRLAAKEFSDMLLESNSLAGCYDFPCLRRYAEKVERAFPGLKAILFLESFRKLVQERTKILNDQIRSGVHRMMESETGQNSQRSKSSKATAIKSYTVPASKEMFESGLIWLQMNTEWRVQLSETQPESEKLIVSFTEAISMIPERLHRDEQMLKLRFAATVKSGSDLPDIWKKILLEVRPCTDSVAEAIIAQYPTYRSLYQAYNAAGSVAACQGLLADLMVKRITGASRRIGPALSAKIYQAIMCEDPGLAIFDPAPQPKAFVK